MNVPEYRLGSWKEFKDYIYDHIFTAYGASRGEYVFRGQSNATWSLTSSLDRKYSGNPDWEDIEKALVLEFGHRCENVPELERLMADEDRSLAFAQHHGLPTRLLDWTESPYVAAYFAFSGALERLSRELMNETEQVAIWIAFMGSTIWQMPTPPEHSEGVHFFKIPSWQNARMHNQSGVFSINNSRYKSIDDYVRSVDESDIPLAKVTVPASEVVLAIQDLDLMEISADKLFGSIDGKAQAAETRVLLELLKRR